jgi:phosphoribosylanthranilate isomerase
MAKIKICGLKEKKEIEYVNLAKPDYAGFVFAGTKRKIDFKTAKTLRSLLDKNIKSVGVFVDEPEENVVSLCKERVIDLIQLHGDEDENYIDVLRGKTGCKIIKAVRYPVKTSGDGKRKESKPAFADFQLPSKPDFLLFDSGAGSGKTFDWTLIPKTAKPFFLAGGLNKDNIAEALEFQPYCVDLSSGVETDGKKDFDKIIEIVKAVRKFSCFAK